MMVVIDPNLRPSPSLGLTHRNDSMAVASTIFS
jgi:hypothetical protein